ncbi:site-specific integrase, partial [Candidatus Dojkabacteria bacterium]|nr:site-specific integrase [Candidatus Dojkabacteria bacterium]
REYSSIGEREVPLTDKVLFILKDYLFEHEHAKEKDFPLFYTSKNKPMRIRNIRSAVNRAFNNAKIPEICVNDLRNTFIVKQLEYGNTLEFVASLVGHKTILTTERYLRLLSKKYQPNTINKVAEI